MSKLSTASGDRARAPSAPLRPETSSAARRRGSPSATSERTASTASASLDVAGIAPARARRRSRPSALRRTARRPRRPPAHDLLEALRQLAAHRDRPLRQRGRERRRATRGAAAADSNATAAWGHRQFLPQRRARTTAARQEAQELVPLRLEPARDERGRDRRRARRTVTSARPRAPQRPAAARVVDPRQPRVADERDAFPRPQPVEQLVRARRLVVAVVAEQPLRADAVPVEQARRMARVLAQHDVGLRELVQHAQRDVVEVADRRRADCERHARPATARGRRGRRRPAPPRPRARPGRCGRCRAPGRAPRPRRPLGPGRAAARPRAEAAADGDHLGDEDVDERDHACTEIASDTRERLDRPLVAGLAGVDERAAVVVAELGGDAVGRTSRGQRLQMAAARAGAAARRPVTSTTMCPSSAPAPCRRGTDARRGRDRRRSRCRA